MLFIVATNVVASQPPERQPTRTPHARATMTLDIDPVEMYIFDQSEA